MAPNLINKSLPIKGIGQSSTNKKECKNSWLGWSQDDRQGGHGISTQLGHLPGTAGEPRTPKEMGGAPSDQVGCGGE